MIIHSSRHPGGMRVCDGDRGQRTDQSRCPPKTLTQASRVLVSSRMPILVSAAPEGHRHPGVPRPPSWRSPWKHPWPRTTPHGSSRSPPQVPEFEEGAVPQRPSPTQASRWAKPSPSSAPNTDSAPTTTLIVMTAYAVVRLTSAPARPRLIPATPRAVVDVGDAGTGGIGKSGQRRPAHEAPRDGTKTVADDRAGRADRYRWSPGSQLR